MVLAAPLAFADYDIEVLTTFGMQTQKAELQSISTYEGYSNFERFQDGYAELRGSLGLSSAEYFDIEAKAIIDIYDHSAVEFYASGRPLQEQVQLGTRINLKAPVSSDVLKIEAGLDANYPISSTAVHERVYVDMYSKLAFEITPSLEGLMQLSLPVYTPADISHYQFDDMSSYFYYAKPSFSVGLKFRLWPFDLFGEEQDEVVVQEPIAIAVNAYNYESADVAEEEVFDFEEDEEEFVVASEPEQELGWFAQLIEFIVRLFKF
jgi:hypothetical protein